MEGGRWGLVIVAAAFLIQVFAFGLSASIGVYNVEFLNYFDDDTVGVSLIAAINWAVFLGSGPIASFLMTKMSFRKIALLGSMMTVAGVLLMPVLPYIPALCVCFGLLAGVGLCLVYVPSHVLCGLYYERHQSLATGIATSGSGLGGAIMPIVIGKLIEYYGWKGSLIVMGGMELHLIVCAALLRSPPKGNKTKDRETQALLNGSHGEGIVSSSAEDGTENVIEMKPNKEKVASEDTAVLMIKEDASVESNGADTLQAAMNATEESRSVSGETEIPKESHVPVMKNGSSLSDAAGLQQTGNAGAADLTQPLHSADASSKKQSVGDHESCAAETEVKVLRHIYLFTDAGFDVYFLSSIFWNAAAATVLSFGPELTTEAGISELNSAWLLTLFGLGDFIGGVIGGVIGNIWTRHRLAQYVVANLLCGVCIAACPLGSTFGEFAAILLCGGLAFGVILGLLVVVLIDLIGTDNLGDGLGYIMLANGLGAFTGPSLTGYLRKVTGSYDLAFYIAGLFAVVAGASMLLIPVIGCLFPSTVKTKPKSTSIIVEP